MTPGARSFALKPSPAWAATWVGPSFVYMVPAALVGAAVDALRCSNRSLSWILAATASMFDPTGLVSRLVITLTMNQLVDRLEKRASLWKQPKEESEPSAVGTEGGWLITDGEGGSNAT